MDEHLHSRDHRSAKTSGGATPKQENSREGALKNKHLHSNTQDNTQDNKKDLNI